MNIKTLQSGNRSTIVALGQTPGLSNGVTTYGAPGHVSASNFCTNASPRLSHVIKAIQ